VPVEAVRDLSMRRANAIKEALLKKYTDLDANRFNVDGLGWDRLVDPLNQSKNRRVEIKVLTAEKAN
jgi:outer membrane protein OmpA-like peptidoglycan-associated protein